MGYSWLFTFVAYDTAGPTLQRNEALRVITYNVQQLPLEMLNRYPNSKYRAKRQAELLINYDIVGLNEAFVDRRRQEMKEIFQEAWGNDLHVVTADERDRSLLGLDSGLLLITRLPVLASHALTFGNDSKVRERGLVADGYARKGALHARVLYTSPEHREITLDCFLTHLESVDSGRREEQVSMLAQFMKQHSLAENPILLLGDLNIAGGPQESANQDSPYWRLRRELQRVRVSWIDIGNEIGADNRSTFNANSATGGQRLDYIFFSDSICDTTLTVLSSSVQKFADPHVEFLSDHSALEAEFEWGK